MGTSKAIETKNQANNNADRRLPNAGILAGTAKTQRPRQQRLRVRPGPGDQRPGDHALHNFRSVVRFHLSLLGFVAGTSFGLLRPGAWAGLPDGNWPGGKLALEGAIRSSSSSIWKEVGRSWLSGSMGHLIWERKWKLWRTG